MVIEYCTNLYIFGLRWQLKALDAYYGERYKGDSLLLYVAGSGTGARRLLPMERSRASLLFWDKSRLPAPDLPGVVPGTLAGLRGCVAAVLCSWPGADCRRWGIAVPRVVRVVPPPSEIVCAAFWRAPGSRA